MEDYELEHPADVVVGWIVQAVKQGRAGLLTNSWREYVVDESFRPETGGYEETDVREVTAVGSLEAAPEHRPDSWILRVRVNDDLADRFPEDEEGAEDGPKEISLDQFWNEFIAPGRGEASIWVSASDPGEKAAFDQFLDELERASRRREPAA